MKIIECQQYTWDYWQAHRGLPGASDADKIATPSKGDYPSSSLTLIAKLIADTYNPLYGMYDDATTASMRNGLWMEPKARSFLEFEGDYEIKQIGLCVSDDGNCCCSPDGLIGEVGGIELKVPDHHTHVKYLLAGTLPNEYRPQVHWSLIVTGREWWDWASWSPFLPPLVVRVVPDTYTEKLRANMSRFHDEYMQAMEKIKLKFPPPPPPVVVSAAGFGSVEVTAQDAYW